MSEKQQSDLLELFLIALRTDPNAEAPSGLDQSMADFARRLRQEGHLAAPNAGARSRVWKQAISQAQLSQTHTNGGNPMSSNAYILPLPARKPSHALPLAAALLVLVGLAAVLLVMRGGSHQPSASSINGGLRQDASPTLVPSATWTLTPTATLSFTPVLADAASGDLVPAGADPATSVLLPAAGVQPIPLIPIELITGSKAVEMALAGFPNAQFVEIEAETVNGTPALQVNLDNHISLYISRYDGQILAVEQQPTLEESAANPALVPALSANDAITAAQIAYPERDFTTVELKVVQGRLVYAVGLEGDLEVFLDANSGEVLFTEPASLSSDQ